MKKADWKRVVAIVWIVAAVVSVSGCGLLGCGGAATNGNAFGGCQMHESF
jgi:hypothetical protein